MDHEKRSIGVEKTTFKGSKIISQTKEDHKLKLHKTHTGCGSSGRQNSIIEYSPPDTL